MKVVIKNFFRNSIANLTIRSVRHFMPDAEFYSLNLYKKAANEYDSQPTLDVKAENIILHPSKYVDLGPSVGNKWNNLFFSEPYNLIYQHFKNSDEKILMIAEDHFFTNGLTLKELQEKDFDVAYAQWNGYSAGVLHTHGVNGSILCVNPKRVAAMFPISEEKTSVEHVLRAAIDKIEKSRQHALSTRYGADYKGDGFYSNTEEEISEALKKVGI